MKLILAFVAWFMTFTIPLLLAILFVYVWAFIIGEEPKDVAGWVALGGMVVNTMDIGKLEIKMRMIRRRDE